MTAVVHFAAYAYVGESVTNPRKYFRNNVAGTLNLLDAMVDAGVRDIVFSSTCATYGEPQRVPIDGGPSPETRSTRTARPSWPSRRCCTGTARLRPAVRGAALLQRRRRRSRRRGRRGPRSGDAPDPAGDRGGAGAARAWRSTAPTTRRPTEPRSATTSTCRIWPTRTSRRWTAAGRRRPACSSTSAPAAGTRCAR